MKAHFTVILSLLFSSFAWSQSGGSWSKKADVGTSNRESAVGFSINSKGYIGLGIVGGSPNGTMWEFDPSTNAWTQKANMTGGGRVNPVAFVANGRVFVGTGEDITFTRDKKIYEFSPLSNVWTARTDFGGTARTEAVAFGIGSKGYLGTGYDGARRKDFWEYDPTTNAWTQKADFGGTARQRAVGFSIGTKGYIGTGNDGSLKKDFWEYDPATNTWTQKSDLPGGARESAVGFSLNSKGYIATGDGGTGRNDIWEYNPTQDEWVQRASFTGDRRYVAAGFATSTKGYIGTGFTDAPAVGVSTKDFYEFTPPVPPVAPTYAMVTAFTESSIRIHWADNSSDETGFIVERSSDGTAFTAVATEPANATSYLDNGLTTGQTYYYRVRAAKSTEGISAATNVVSQTTGDPGNGVWNILAQGNNGNPQINSGATAFTLDGLIYITAGPDASSAINATSKQLWAYDPSTNAFTQKAEFPGEARTRAVSFTVNGQAYFGGGSKGSGAESFVKDFWQYDPTTNQWTQRADMPSVGRYSPLEFVIGSRAYLGGGFKSGGGTAVDFYEYDPATDAWTSKADLPFTGSKGEGIGYNGKGYVLVYGSPTSVYVYDPALNTWTPGAQFPSKLYAANAFVSMGNRMFAHMFTHSTPYQSTFWELEVANNRWIERALHYDGSQYFGAVLEANSNAVYMFSGSVCYSWSPDFEVKTPTNVVAEVIDPSKIRLTWQAYSDAATIEIYRSENEQGPYSLIAQPAADQREYVDGFNGASKTAYYRLRAVNGSHQSAYSKTAVSSKRGAWKNIGPIANATYEIFGDASASTSTRGYSGISSYSDKWWEYNPENNSWTQKANFPGELRSSPVTFVIANKIYAGFGYNWLYEEQKYVYYKDLYQYDPVANTWTKKGGFPGAARRNASVASSNSKGYLIGGDDDTGASSFLNETWEYDPATDAWTALADVPVGVAYASAYVKDDVLYLVNGGRKTAPNQWGSILQAYSLDLTTGNWKKDPNPTGQAGGDVHIINDVAYFDEKGMMSYDHAAKQWSVKPALPALGSFLSQSFGINGKIYVMTSTYEMWVYNPGALIAPHENLDSKFQGDRILLTWDQTSEWDVKTKIQYTTGNSLFKDLTTVGVGVSQYVFSDLLPNKNYRFKVVAVNANGEQSTESNITFENAGPAWTEIADIPMQRREHAMSFFNGGKLYYGTGKVNGANVKDMWEFDPATGVWTQKADVPGAERSEATAFTLGGDTYVGFGAGNNGHLKDLYKYSPATNTWTASANYPNDNTIVGPGVFVHEGYAYLIGGHRNYTATVNELWRFDGTSWTQLTSLPGETRKNPGVFVLNGKAYVGGGVKIESYTTSYGNRDFWQYDISSDEWTPLPDMPNDINTDSRRYTISGTNSAMMFFTSNTSIGGEGLGIKACIYNADTKKWTLSSDQLHTDWMSSIYTVAQDPTTGFAYATVSHAQFGHKVWRFNTLLDGPNLVEVKSLVPGSARLKWRRMTPQPDSVVVFRSESPNVLGIRQGVVTTADTVAGYGIGNGTTYYFKIRAYSNNGQYKTSAERALVVDAIPSAPLELTGELAGDNVILTWQPGPGVVPTSYVVERAVQNSSSFQPIGTTSTTDFTSPDIIAATMRYRVKAISGGGESDYSNIVVVLVTGVEENGKIGVYPNPVIDFITIEVAPQDGVVNMQLLDYNGRKIAAQTLTSTTRIDMSSQPAGIYFVNLISTKSASNKYIKIIKK